MTTNTNPEDKKLKWPLDAATTIALVALVVSLAQFILTTPILSEIYFSPALVVREIGNDKNDPNLITFELKNEGATTAKNVQIGLTCHDSDKIILLPEKGSTITKNARAFIKTYDIFIPYLAKDETMVIVITVYDINQKYEIRKLEDETNKWLKVGPFPSVPYVRCESGLGKIKCEQIKYDVLDKDKIDSIKVGTKIIYVEK